MKKLLSTAAAVALLSSSAMAMDMLDMDKAYAGAGIAMESYTGLDAGAALVLNYGVPIKDINVGPGKLAVETEFSYTIVSPSTSYEFPTGIDYTTYAVTYETFSIDATLMTLGAYGAYSYDLIPNLSAKIRAGLVYKSVTVESSLGDESESISDSEIGLAYGAGLNYVINDQIDVYTDYTMIEGSDIVHYTLGAQYRF